MKQRLRCFAERVSVTEAHDQTPPLIPPRAGNTLVMPLELSVALGGSHCLPSGDMSAHQQPICSTTGLYVRSFAPYSVEKIIIYIFMTNLFEISTEG